MKYNKFRLRFERLIQEDDFNEKQMEVIWDSMENGLNDEEIRTFLNSSFNIDQMKSCVYGFLCGLSVEDVKKYAKSDYNFDEMEQIRFSLMKPKEREYSDYLLDQGFNFEQMIEIRKGSDLPQIYVEIYAMPYYSADQMKEIRLGFQHGLGLKHVALYCDSRFTKEKMSLIRSGFEAGVPVSKAIEYAQPDIPVDSIYLAVKKAKRELINTRQKNDKINMQCV